MSDQIECHNYTLGRRYPMVLGRISDFTLPWPITMPQLAAGLAGLSVALATRGLWRLVVGASPLAGLVVLITAVMIPMVIARPTRIEGRSLLAATAGQLRLRLRPRHGVCRGQRVSGPRRRRTSSHIVTVKTMSGPVPDVEPGPAAPTARPAWTSVR